MSGKWMNLLAAGLVLLCSVHLAADGKIEFKKTSASFGEINEGKVADVQFEFTNSGDSMLVIKQVRATCGCTVTQLTKKEYQPGESGVIPVRFFSRGYQGRVVKTITVTSTDSENPKVRLQITGTIRVTNFADITISDKELDLGKLTLGKTVKRQLTIINPGNLSLRITQVRHKPDLYLVFPKTILEPGEKMNVDLFYNPSREGTFSSYVFLTSNALGKGEEMIRINVEVK